MRILVAAVVAVSVLGIGVQAAQCQQGQIELHHGWHAYKAQAYKGKRHKGPAYKSRAYKGRAYKGQGYKSQGQGFMESCRWLRARALTSHNPIWMQRYKACKAG